MGRYSEGLSEDFILVPCLMHIGGVDRVSLHRIVRPGGRSGDRVRLDVGHFG